MTSTSGLPVYPTPRKGASLLLALRPVRRPVLVIGSGNLAAARAYAALEADAYVTVAGCGGISSACPEIRWRVSDDQLQWADLPDTSEGGFSNDEDWGNAFGSLLDSFEYLALVCVTDTLLDSASSGTRRTRRSAELIHRACRARRILLNVTDIPELCDVNFPSTHRFIGEKSHTPTHLQLAITTNGKGCRIASRIRREILGKLPKNVGDAVENIAVLRHLSQQSLPSCDSDLQESQEEDAAATVTPLNKPVPQYVQGSPRDMEEELKRRMRWVAQISEYWPLERLGAMGSAEMKDLASSKDTEPLPVERPENNSLPKCRHRSRSDGQASDIDGSKLSRASLIDPTRVSPESRHNLDIVPLHSNDSHRGRILLVGSGPGHPSLLTVAARRALTELATLILSDKLVPSQVLDLIPSTIPVHIAKKFPGNAEGAQNELMELALDGARRGEIVVRLKQGDPMLYGRGGEEVLYFRSHGFEPLVIPGVSSALAGPLLVGIPVTQRGVAESLIVCTGVGRQGREVQLPGYQRSRTLVILMGVARIAQLIRILSDPDRIPQRDGAAYPPNVPIAVIERASCPDQRFLASTLDQIQAVLERSGDQRPPGMIIVGWSVLALYGTGDLSVLDDGEGLRLEELDQARVRKWVGDTGFIMKDGLDGWQIFDT